ncbi:hypothetical protein CVT24_007161 [Panaeolus cyanescens]|uniref:AB hydrolase-1 domain-containing protein n=1 Tax=Panaeolus cyanescens TaxID=181874 RepID=A0A409YPI9_9AGAR|nr:hypothetical protein CVT24_007161 [Panaeolus cyanescens]
MLHETITLPPDADSPLYIVAKRYWMPGTGIDDAGPSQSEMGRAIAAQALTLVFLHSTSFHKETWEPALEDLFQCVIGQSGPNHGGSCEKYAMAVHRFMTARPKLGNGQRVDFRTRKLVGIGHSLGGNAMVMLQRIQPTFDFSSLIIVEPMVSPEGGHHLYPLREKLVAGAAKRRDRWSSREEVSSYFKSLKATSQWDPRVLEKFINYGTHWRQESEAFVLSCSRKQEIVMYMDEGGPTKPVEALNIISQRMPVHLILGDKKDLIPPHIHRSLTDPKSGRRFASIHGIPGVGHLVNIFS